MTMNLNSHVELYDSDLLALEQGPMAWMKSKQQSSMNLEDFRRAVVEKFADAGFKVDVKVFDTNQEGVYAFDVEIREKIERKAFDFDRQVHEVTRNILELPDQEGGFIKTDQAMMEMLRKEREQGKHRH